jgi:hypothetical protein
MLPFSELMMACECEAASVESGKRLVLTWINYSKPEELPKTNAQYNDMHIFGFGLAYMLSKYNPLQTREREWNDLPAFLSMHGVHIAKYSYRKCLDFLRLLQSEYDNTLQYDESVGFEADLDMTLLLLVVMQRVGDHLRQEIRMDAGNTEDVKALYERVCDESEWYVPNAQTRKEMFDILHVLMRLFFVLLDAEAVSVETQLVKTYVKELSTFQYEASLHDFYNLSMVADCLPASILIYKHEYKEMFNDPSQVVYFHTPTYKRQRQVEFETITTMTAGNVNVLPIIQQIKPDVSVLYEHTGACNSTTCSAEPWTWLVINKHIVLCDKNGKYYVAKNIYVLFAYLMSMTDE